MGIKPASPFCLAGSEFILLQKIMNIYNIIYNQIENWIDENPAGIGINLVSQWRFLLG